MAVNLSPIGNGQQFFDNNGQPLNGGLIYTYQAGSTTPLASYTTISGNVANTNPIVLDSSGRPPTDVWLTYGYFYKFVVKTSAAVTIGTYDNIYGIVGVQASSGTTIPTGLISLWSGAIGSVPAGWYLCDGTNGTPDLRDKFLVGAGSTYSVNATGGTADAIVVSHTHTASSSVSDPTHVHTATVNAGTGGGSGPVFGAQAGGPSSSNVATTNAASTGVSVSTTITSAGTSGTNQNLPPYYALCYVMKA
jgi:microcystin-dependent protein